MSLLWITKAKYLNQYKIEIEFNNNKLGIVDLENYLNTGVFSTLKSVEIFKNFKLNAWTIEWENGVDFAPEFLYEKLKSNSNLLNSNVDK